MLIKALFLATLVVAGILLEKIFLKKSKDIPSILGKTQEKMVGVGHDRPVQESDFVNDSIKKVEEVGGIVLGEVTDNLNKLTSDAGSFVSDVIYDNSIGKVVDQIDKLPKDQQERIREEICK